MHQSPPRFVRFGFKVITSELDMGGEKRSDNGPMCSKVRDNLTRMQWRNSVTKPGECQKVIFLGETGELSVLVDYENTRCLIIIDTSDVVHM